MKALIIISLILAGCSSGAVGTWSRTSETMSTAIRVGDNGLVIGASDSSNEDYIFKRDARFKKRRKSCVK